MKFCFTKKRFTNSEKNSKFNFSIPNKPLLRNGISALLRIKNEEKKIELCLNSIYEIFDEIIFVNNGSTDRTLKIVQEFKRLKDQKNKIKMFDYPFEISRCGAENERTDEYSVHSLSYFYNFTLSRASYEWVCKWDGDMILSNKIDKKKHSRAL